VLVGDLLIRMSTDMADLRTGLDQSRQEFNKFASDAGSALDRVRGQLIALATGYSLVETIRQTIEYGTALQRLQDITGLAAAEVQQLSLIAKLNDADAQTLTKSWGKMVQQLVDVGSEGEKARAIMKALGVDAFDPLTGKLKPANELLAAMATQFNAITDPATRAKIASEFFAKSYQDMLVIFANWKEDSEKVKGLFESIAPATDDATKKADAFGDSFTLLAETTKAKLLPYLGDLATLLESLRTWLLESGTASEGFGNKVNVLTQEILPAAVQTLGALAIAAISLVEAFYTLGKGLNDAPGADSYAEKWARVRQAMADANKVIDDSNVKIDSLFAATQRATNQVTEDSNARARNTPIVKDNGDAALQAAANLKAEEAARKAAADAAAKEAEALQKLKEKYDLLAAADAVGLATNTVQQLTELGTLLDKGKISWDEYNTRIGLVLDKDPILAGEQRDLNKSLDDMAKLVDAVREARAKELTSIDDQISKQQQANATFGLGKAAVVDYTIAELQRQQAEAAGIPGEEASIDQLQKRIDKLYLLRDAVGLGEALELQKKQLEDAARNWDKFVTDIGHAFGDFLNTWVNDGASKAFKNLWDNFKKWALNALAEIAAKQIVVSITGALGTTGAGAGGLIPGGGAGGGIGIGDIGKLFGLGGNGSTSLATTLATALAGPEAGAAFGAAAGAGLESGLATLGIAAEAGAEAVGGLAAVAGAAVAVIPVVGAVIAAAYLAYTFLAQAKGGPKEGGFATTGNTSGITNTDPNGRWFTPNTQDAGLQKAVEGMQSNYEKILSALGGTGSATFAQGFSTDPKGTAPSNVHTGVFVNGQEVFDNANGNVGRKPEDLEAELQTQSQRAILAALQASELPDVIHGYLASIDVSTATIEQINDALQHAAELKVLVDLVSALPEDLANGLLGALGASDEMDAKIAQFAINFGAFTKAQGELQDQLDRKPADEVKALALAHASTFEKVGLARSALGDMLSSYDGSTRGHKETHDRDASLRRRPGRRARADRRGAHRPGRHVRRRATRARPRRQKRPTRKSSFTRTRPTRRLRSSKRRPIRCRSKAFRHHQ
jgi:hypothetical protein